MTFSQAALYSRVCLFAFQKLNVFFSFCANLCSETLDFKCLCLTHIKKGFSCGSAGKESACNTGDLGLIPGLGRSPEEGKGYPLQYYSLVYSTDYPWSHEESDTTERLSLTHIVFPQVTLQKQRIYYKNSHELILFGNTVLPVHWAELVLMEMRS